MKRSTFSIALQLASFIEDHSEREIRDAVSLIKARGGNSFLLDYLTEPEKIDGRREKTKLTKKRSDVLQSKVVSALEAKEPEKYRVLVEFEKMVRRGQVLASFDNLKRFGERISKDFSPKKSRKDSISPLIALIAERSVDEIENLFSYASSLGTSEDADQYQRLARFLIKGKEPS
jgi:hypothetical protein